MRSIDLKVAAGEVVALIGANAAGKSTTMRLIAGLKRATSGSIRLDGIEIEPLSTPKRVHLGIALVPERGVRFCAITVLENLTMGAYNRADRNHIQHDIDAMFAMFPRLGERRNRRAGLMSGGEQQMGRDRPGVMSKPSCLLLDEPTLRSRSRHRRRDRGDGDAAGAGWMTILLAEQNAAMALGVATGPTFSPRAGFRRRARRNNCVPRRSSSNCISARSLRRPPCVMSATKGRFMLNRRQQGQVAVLTIDRANRRNALGTELMQAFDAAFTGIDRDDSIAAVVVSAGRARLLRRPAT